MKRLVLVGLPLLTCSLCMAFASVNVDYSHGADFAKFHTYSWIKVQAEDSLWNDRIQRSVDAQLMAKGWQQVPDGGDAAVAAYGSTHSEQQMQTLYDGFGGGWGWGGFGDAGMSTTTVQKIPVGSLLVDIFDSGSKKLVWRGQANGTLSTKPEKNEKKLDKAVGEMFKKFPPSQKG